MLTAYTKCPICGKQFYVASADVWVYKKNPRKGHDKTILFCTWTCMRAWERSKDEGQN